MALPEWSQHLTAPARSAAVDLSGIGSSGVALPVASAAEALAAVSAAGCAVLGGDLLAGAREKLRHTGDNWHCEMEPGEAWVDYVKRSNQAAAQYLATVRQPSDLWFTVVVSPKPSAAQLSRSYDR